MFSPSAWEHGVRLRRWWGWQRRAHGIPGSAGASQKLCPKDAAHQPWRAARELVRVPLPPGHEDAKWQQAGLGVGASTLLAIDLL